MFVCVCVYISGECVYIFVYEWVSTAYFLYIIPMKCFVVCSIFMKSIL